MPANFLPANFLPANFLMYTEVIAPATVWQSGRLGHADGPHRVLFGQMYEDPEIEAAAFAGKRRVFCIASAGNTAGYLAHLGPDSAPEEIIACDINSAQLDYAKRRVHGAPWHPGDADRFMNFARFFTPLIGWRRSIVEEFLTLTEPHYQLEFWHRHLNTRRFRAGFDVLLSRRLLGTVYSPQLLTFLPRHFGSVLRGRLERGFALHPNAANPFARALLLGGPADITPTEIPTHPTPAAAKIKFILADAADYLEWSPAHSIDAFTLSNILDGADSLYRLRLARAVHHAAAPGAVIVLRSFAEPTHAAAHQPATNHIVPTCAAPNYAAQDRSLLWGTVDIRRAEDILIS